MTERTLLIVEDDDSFARTLKRSFERRNYRVLHAASTEEVEGILATDAPQFAVVDLKLGTESGLSVVAQLHAHNEDMAIVVLTGFASIATAVEAVKRGACNYLVKPSNSDDIELAFQADGESAKLPEVGTRPTSIKTLEMERIHAVLVETDFNISEAARRLGMHRRTLARKLNKRFVS